jgi:hypothetical protein
MANQGLKTQGIEAKKNECLGFAEAEQAKRSPRLDQFYLGFVLQSTRL